MLSTPTPHRPDKRQQQDIARELWLIYFNDSLLKAGIISREDHDKMRIKIHAQTTNIPTNHE